MSFRHWQRRIYAPGADHRQTHPHRGREVAANALMLDIDFGTLRDKQFYDRRWYLHRPRLSATSDQKNNQCNESVHDPRWWWAIPNGTTQYGSHHTDHFAEIYQRRSARRRLARLRLEACTCKYLRRTTSYHSTKYYTIPPLYCKYIIEPTSRYHFTDLAPYPESSSKISSRVVYWEGVSPDSSRALTSALCSSNNRATWILPSSTASCSEVLLCVIHVTIDDMERMYITAR
jgi:hypothetical protein